MTVEELVEESKRRVYVKYGNNHNSNLIIKETFDVLVQHYESKLNQLQAKLDEVTGIVARLALKLEGQ